MLLLPLLGCWLRMPAITERGEGAEMLADPKVRLPPAYRSGPLVVELECRVALENARAFHKSCRMCRSTGNATAAYGWSVARDIAGPEL